MPPNYRQQQGLPLHRHERRAAAVLAAALVAAGAGVGAFELAGGTGGHASRARCVRVIVASSTGGGAISHCGADARVWCHTETTGAGVVASEARSACRRQGY